MTRDDIMGLANETAGQHWMDEAHIQRFAKRVAAAEHNALRDAAEWALEALTQASVLCAEGTSTRRSVDAAMNALREALGGEE